MYCATHCFINIVLSSNFFCSFPFLFMFRLYYIMFNFIDTNSFWKIKPANNIYLFPWFMMNWWLTETNQQQLLHEQWILFKWQMLFYVTETKIKTSLCLLSISMFYDLCTQYFRCFDCFNYAYSFTYVLVRIRWIEKMLQFSSRSNLNRIYR